MNEIWQASVVAWNTTHHVSDIKNCKWGIPNPRQIIGSRIWFHPSYPL